ncbi:hypothetical protein T08_9404 [Trichinella sp. T8]|nr:hypothetical protein T08_9404 [Trichinella sp. T8]
MTRFQCIKLLQASDALPTENCSGATADLGATGVPTMTGQFWVSLCPVAVHRGLYTFEKPKMARYDGSADAAEASSS